jgi:hypothetical protein
MRVALVSSHARSEADGDEVPLLDALIWRGVEAGVVGWDDRAADWAAFDLAVLHGASYEQSRAREFARWVRRIERRVRLANSASLVEWNLDRSYLRELAQHGVPIVPTTWVEPGDAVRIPDRGDVVVKPTAPTDAHQTVRYHLPDDASRARADVDALLERGAAAMIQPYLPAVEQGVLCLVYVDGVFSHAVTRRGDDAGAATASSEQRAAGDRAVGSVAAREPVLYARVDLLEDLRGEPLVTAVELIAPALYLDDDDTVDRLADAIARWAAGA